jgi:hypothetical protein
VQEALFISAQSRVLIQELLVLLELLRDALSSHGAHAFRSILRKVCLELCHDDLALHCASKGCAVARSGFALLEPFFVERAQRKRLL